MAGLNRKHLSIRFNLEDAWEREIWEKLQQVDKRKYKSFNHYMLHLLGKILEEQEGKQSNRITETEIEHIAKAVVKELKQSGMTAILAEENDKTNTREGINENIEGKSSDNQEEKEIEIPDDILDFALG